MPSVLEVKGFRKAYHDTLAVAELSFRVESGQVLGLVGPNGAGKTTTLRAVSGIIPPTEGTLRVGGCDIAADPVGAKRQLAYVPDDPKLFEGLTVWEHFEFIASAYDVDGFEARADRLLEAFELGEKRDTPAQELSRGMRQKTAVCCAYLHDPALILFDEPIAGLDPRGIRTLKTSMVDRASQGAAVVVSSHMLDLVEDLCTHLLILHRGACLYWGPKSDARAHFDDLEGDATLEEIFFRATEGPPVPRVSPPELP